MKRTDILRTIHALHVLGAGHTADALKQVAPDLIEDPHEWTDADEMALHRDRMKEAHKPIEEPPV